MTVKPLSTAGMAAAQAGARRAVEAIQRRAGCHSMAWQEVVTGGEWSANYQPDRR
jgi:hypothetical protein